MTGDRSSLGIRHPRYILRLHWIRLMMTMPHDTATARHIQDIVFTTYVSCQRNLVAVFSASLHRTFDAQSRGPRLGTFQTDPYELVSQLPNLCAAQLHGDGNSVSNIGVPWLPQAHTFHLIFPPRTLPGDTKVTNLIVGNEWNEGLILVEFETCDANCILSIKLLNSNTRDKLLWHYEKNGRFSVCNAYLLSCALADQTSTTEEHWSWSFIWEARVPPKVQLFLWKLCNNGLATIANMHRGITLEEGCPICDAIEEDIKHVFLLYPLERNVWALANLQWEVISVYTGGSE
ncbi:hypothetical protein Sango_2829500 [Sesamum angolense]|uniref:Reverse transcriptase zinc-binding domain-containing protein n=1 Tax=Sesamum angolense TaxID=2727404 RepID=A0AAE1T7D7_9LAMI|nr:hypothetical protein Sango_2829500 [Sesamum angolense]